MVADSHLIKEAEQEYAERYGRAHPDIAWINTIRDQMLPNPFYFGQPQPHPASDFQDDASDD